RAIFHQMAKGSNYHRWPLETPQRHLPDLGRWKRMSVDGPHDYRIEAELAAGHVVHGSDATTSTQNKYRNITTTGNTVWD
ncbi:hypothetical protein KC319_g23198, partial [Hortaea werneckii]